MRVEVRHYVQHQMAETPEYKQVLKIALDLLNLLNTDRVLASIDNANQPGASSSDVQKAFRTEAQFLGFKDESKGLFQGYKSNGLRPDYFKKLKGTGIILEVERGKTTMNNMDLLDFWKCHICAHAHYLFLLVPVKLVQNNTAKVGARNEFASVNNRLATFFLKESNYTSVRGLSIFGY